MRIASWNINSIRMRIDKVIDFLKINNIDILALQETKVRDQLFPLNILQESGYHVEHIGENQWNGVSIISRYKLENIQYSFTGQPSFKGVVEARCIHATCKDILIYSLYVPHGRSVNDDHMLYKLEWLKNLYIDITKKLTINPNRKIILAGDWNIAPLDQDVWDISKFKDSTHITKEERCMFDNFLKIGFIDPGRIFYKNSNNYTYWDYKNLSFPLNNGMRIDFVLTTKNIKIKNSWVAVEERRKIKPSDHAPIILDISL